MRFSFLLLLCIAISSADYAQSPGGISANNTMWLRSDVALSGSSNTVSQWNEISGANVTGNFTVQPIPGTITAQTAPTIIDAGINFNPYVRFDGFTNSLSGNNSFPGTSLVANTNVTVFQVFNLKGGIVWLKWETDQVGATGRLGFENSPGTIRFDFPKAVPATAGQNIGNINILNKHSLSTCYADATTSVNRLSGADNTTIAIPGPGDFSASVDKIVIGNDNLLNLPAQIDMAEVIIYKATLTAIQRNKIESYLAVKYGFTLDQAAVNANDYTASDGTIIWNRSANSTYANDITGIGRDDASGLAQKQSKSINANSLITLYSNGMYTAGNFPLLNSTNPNSFTNDRSFFLVGDNAAPTAINQCFFNGKAQRMQRAWKVSETNTALPVTISIDNGSIPATAKNIIVSPDPAFPVGNTTFYPLTAANGKIYASVPFNHNDYFTYSTDTIIATFVITQPPCTAPNGGAVTTTVSGGNAPYTYSWSPSGQLTANLTGVAGGTYSLTITHGGCQTTQDVTLQQSGGPAAPVIPGGSTVCVSNGSLSLQIQNPNTAYSYNWYDAATGGSLLFTGTVYTTAAITTTYTIYVEAADGICNSPRTPVQITYGPATAATVIPVTICPGNTASLTIQNAVVGYTYNWYADQAHTALLASGTTFTTPVLNSSTDYFIESSTVANCTAQSSATVNVNIAMQPLVNNIGLCEAGIATLTVQNPIAGYTYSWYSVLTGGTALGSGVSFNTPSLSAGTTYYVQAAVGTCLSIRTPVAVTIGNATIPVLSNQIICSGNSTSINVENLSAGYTYNWYNMQNGGSVLFSGNSFITPVFNGARYLLRGSGKRYLQQCACTR